MAEVCHHCGEPLPQAPVHADVDGATRAFCCDGCAAAARWILDAHLDDYYRLRSAPAGRVDADAPALAAWDREELLAGHARDIEGLGGVVAGAEAERADRGVHAVGAGLDRLHQAHQGDAGGGVGVHVHAHGFAAVLLDAAHDVIGRLRLEQRGHVLQADRVAAHLHQALRHVDEALHGVQRADGVADRALGVLAGTAHGGDGVLQVADVVQGVEHAEHVHAVLGGLVDEAVDHAVLVMAVAEQVLAAQQHLQARVGQQAAESAQALPGVLVEEADAGVEGGAAPALDRPVAGAVDVLARGDHVFEGHAGGEQALVRVAQGEFGDVDDAGHVVSLCGRIAWAFVRRRGDGT